MSVFFTVENQDITRELLVIPAAILFLVIIWMYLRYRGKQPRFLIPKLPDPVPPRDYSHLGGEELRFASEFWEYMHVFAIDFESRGHPLHYRQLLDLLQFAPSADLKVYAAEVLKHSRHLKLYTNDSELRTEMIDVILKSILESDKITEAYSELLLEIQIYDDEKEKILETITEKLPSASPTQKQVLINIKDSRLTD